MRIPVSALLGLALAGLLARPAAAQGDSASIQEKLDEISRLMRDSERLLLELSQTDALIDRQAEIVKKLAELEPPSAEAPAEAKQEHDRRERELRRQQEETARKLAELEESQARAARSTVDKIEELIRSMPKKKGGGGQPDRQKKGEKEEKKPESGKREEEKQLDAEQRRREQEERERRRREEQAQQRGRERPKQETADAMQRRVEAWIARLPPEEQERLRRGDLSAVPPRYRALVEEYTKAIARRDTGEPKER